MEDTTKSLSKVIRIDESETRGHLDELGAAWKRP